MANQTQTQTVMIMPQSVRKRTQNIPKVFSIKLENSFGGVAVPLPAGGALVLGRVKTYWPEDVYHVITARQSVADDWLLWSISCFSGVQMGKNKKTKDTISS